MIAPVLILGGCLAVVCWLGVEMIRAIAGEDERNGFEEHDWREQHFPAADGAAEDGQGTGGAAVVGKRAPSSAAAD